MTVSNETLVGAQDHREVVAFWFEEHHRTIFRYLLRIVGERELAHDLLQDVFTGALETLRRKPLPDKPLAWLYGIATHLACNARRRRRLLWWLPLRGDEPSSVEFEGALATAQSVRACLAKLRPRDAEALLLHSYAGLSTAEIAALKGEQPTAVRMRLSRAYARFSALYEQELKP